VLVLVGVGGSSSALDRPSPSCMGEFIISSPVMLAKLPRRVRPDACAPKMLAPLPKVSGEPFEVRPLNGVVGLPNS
jgi:hypothetical protein